MFKRLTILLLEFTAGLAGNLVAAYVQQDAWGNLFTPARLLATGAGAALMLLLVAMLETQRSLTWNWPWHRFWYLRGLAADPQIRQWEADFARLSLAAGRRPITTTEVMADGQRQDMVTLLYDAFLQKAANRRQILVLGEPGAGKTTGLERLALELCRKDAWRLGLGRPLPILLRLGNYRDGDLLAFAKTEMGRAVGGQSGIVLSQGLEALLAKGRVVLLCDALDEALGEQRHLVLTELDRFLRSPRYARVGVVITARTREDPGGRLPDLPVYTIQDLHEDAVRAFVRVYRQPGVEEAEIYRRLARAGLLEPGGLGRNPFWLKLVVESGAFQGRKGQILRQAVETLLAREWAKPEAQRAGWQRVLPREQQLAETRQGLAWLAYQMSVAGLVAVAYEQVVTPRPAEQHGPGRGAARAGLPPDLYDETRQALLACGPFASDRELRAVFVDERLALWQASVPEAGSPAARVAGTIEFLYGQDNAAGEDGLVLLLGVLSERLDPGDGQRQQLAGLAERLARAANEAVRSEWTPAPAVSLPDWLQGRGSRLTAADIVGLGRDAQLLGYGPGPLRFRHRLLQEALTAWWLAEDSARRAAAVRRYAGETAWWETLLMLGHLVADPAGLADLALVDGVDETRLFLAIGLLLGQERPGRALPPQITTALTQSVAGGVTEAHKAAVCALAEIDRDGVIAWLVGLLQGEDSLQQKRSFALLDAIGGVCWNDVLGRMDKVAGRVKLGQLWAEVGDPRPGVGTIIRNGQKLPDIVWGGEVPAGRYTIGGDAQAYEGGTERPVTIQIGGGVQAYEAWTKRPVTIQHPYRLARYPVTYVQFQCFVDAEDFGNERWWAGMPVEVKDWGRDVYLLREVAEQAFQYGNHPRERVSWYQAMAFARWLTAKLHAGELPAGELAGNVRQHEITLPHENEWEVAARWPDGRLYPWGNAFDPAKANTNEGDRVHHTTAVGMYPAGRNAALDLYDLSGNVWEWCRNKYDNPNAEAVDGSGDWRVLRGGSWALFQHDARAACRNDAAPALRSLNLGFRLVVVGGGGASSPIS